MVTNSIEKKLSQMRGQLTRWIMVHGLGRWLLVGLGVLAVDMALDRLFKMDFAQRLVMLVVMGAVIGVYFIWRVVRPLLSSATDTALLYEVEAKHPELKEALLSGYQLAREKDDVPGVSQELANRTIELGAQRAEGIRFGDALNLGQSRTNWLLLVVGLVVAGLLGYGVTSNQFLKTWFNRNVMLGTDQWPQATYLAVDGVVDGKLTIARGADHRQLVQVLEKSTEKNVSVSLEVDNPGGRSFLPMKSTGKFEGREHMFTFHNVSTRFRFRATGGDDTTDWVDVELVEPPSVSNLKLKALPPEYTGVKEEELVGSGPHSVLRGSRLAVEIEANKPLAEANLKFGSELIPMKQSGAEQTYQVILPGEGELRGGEYEFSLVDQGGVASNRKSKFRIGIRDDKPPRVQATLLGISGEVVPRAMLPTSFKASDENGLVELAFDCNWKDGELEDSPLRSQAVVFAETGKSGLLEAPSKSVKDVAVLDLIPLKLEPGVSLKMTIKATDNFPTEGNVGRSQEFLLRVVTEPQLRASLLRREIEQREAFDQAYQRQLALSTELNAISVRQRKEDVSEADFRNDQESRLIDAVRQQKNVGTAVDAVAQRFEEFLVEIKNNRLDEAENKIAPDQRIEKRFDEKIIQPIRRLDAELIAEASRFMDNCRKNAGDPEALRAAVAQTDVVHQKILVEMKKILDSMNDSENFQGLINDILEIQRDTKAIEKGIQDQKPKDKDIFDDDDLFDK